MAGEDVLVAPLSYSSQITMYPNVFTRGVQLPGQLLTSPGLTRE